VLLAEADADGMRFINSTASNVCEMPFSSRQLLFSSFNGRSVVKFGKWIWRAVRFGNGSFGFVPGSLARRVQDPKKPVT
jgi:hypothetical protein